MLLRIATGSAKKKAWPKPMTLKATFWTQGASSQQISHRFKATDCRLKPNGNTQLVADTKARRTIPLPVIQKCLLSGGMSTTAVKKNLRGYGNRPLLNS